MVETGLGGPRGSTSVGPVAGPERIQLLDVLRGVAILGILVTNIQHFSMVAGAVRVPTLFGDLQGLNFWVYAGSFNLALQKFLPIFSMLFGAGIVLAAERREAAGLSPGALHYRRMVVLLLIALVHAYLVWYGDILFTYAIAGGVAFLFWRRSPRFLFVLGVVLFAGFPVMRALLFVAPEIFPHIDLFPGMTMEEVVAADLEGFRGGWVENFQLRRGYALEDQTVGLMMHGFWKACGLMLVGMGLFKTRILTGGAKRALYWKLVGWGFGTALPLTLAVFWANYATGWGNFWIREFSNQVIHWAGTVQSLGYLGLVALLCSRGCASWLGRAVAGVGRMALSNYLLQSLLCTFIFYGFGLGLYGSVERVGQMGIVVMVWVGQLALSAIWLSRFRFGPAEWVWRSLAYGNRQAMRVSDSGG